MKLAIVQEWHDALAAQDPRRLRATADSDVEIAGPRGTARGQDALAAWALGSGAQFEPVRWFCGSSGDVVVSQRASWPEDGARTEPVEVATHFRVAEGVVVRIERHDRLVEALSAADLGLADEATSV